MRLDLLLPEESPLARTCPLFLERVPCGFPSPAQDYVEADLDLNSHCVVHPAATFFFRVDGLSGEQPGMSTGDILVVDRSLTPAHDDTIVASVDGEFLIRKLHLHGRLSLRPLYGHGETLYPDPDALDIFGVVTHFVHSTRRR
ncbi:translesion error-prone DNA polymerase V autoproteolytic subunit [Candidatus Pantoea multigeneris]|uniref:Translesion error-prone DNA polymerase V autoproteolytic subunit n=1 Tax=Candidatus Pantoea multigeneris TaxID=2608357 RepID=A0ABX0RKZ5_9GAMM|nr:translesion error-prone DNA polymerase V autoproteolytic subunit [Pantoea multigeneris]NIF24025.1 translesion error-prone DNA polymerase V autoproteolytic subunit [Pantoea multigeneris]